MANFNASQITRLVATPPQKSRSDQSHGRIRLFESLYAAPASGTAPAIADRIIWGQLPVGAVMLSHFGRLDFNAGTAACTINLGDNTQPARYLGATAINAATSSTTGTSGFTSNAACDVTIGTFQLTNVKGMGAFTVGDLITGTGIPAASYVTGIDLLNRTVTFANATNTAATATNAATTIVSTGAPYRISDNTANNDNGFVSTTDDATLISVVAGAQVANNQIIRLLIPYVMD